MVALRSWYVPGKNQALFCQATPFVHSILDTIKVHIHETWAYEYIVITISKAIFVCNVCIVTYAIPRSFQSFYLLSIYTENAKS